jgi:2-polyprenyl-3-methyl-5-hydroxy-6-metoxy-1,4-benzoquinol methylase
MDRNCPICSNAAPFRLRKENVDYHQCCSCLTLFSDPIENSGMIGGEHEEDRNNLQNHLRISRIDEMTVGSKKSDIHILDFGCGHGMLIADLKKSGYHNVTGYDAYSDQFSKLPKRERYQVITAIEVIEHTSHPFVEIDVMHRSLVPGGVVMFETSFIDVAAQENISLDDFFYIAPKNGHSTIFSHHGLDLLMCLKGFIPRRHFDRHVRLYQKPYKK